MRNRQVPPNEIGFVLCKTQAGKLTHGPVRMGTPNSVTYPIACPSGSAFIGSVHTHPGGVAKPSPQDIRGHVQVGAKVMCIKNDHEMKCFRVKA